MPYYSSRFFLNRKRDQGRKTVQALARERDLARENKIVPARETPVRARETPVPARETPVPARETQAPENHQGLSKRI